MYTSREIGRRDWNSKKVVLCILVAAVVGATVFVNVASPSTPSLAVPSGERQQQQHASIGIGSGGTLFDQWSRGLWGSDGNGDHAPKQDDNGDHAKTEEDENGDSSEKQEDANGDHTQKQDERGDYAEKQDGGASVGDLPADVHITHKVLLDCAYNMQSVKNSNSYREPFHFMTEENWAEITGQKKPAALPQRDRVASLVASFRVAAEFLTEKLKATWWVRSGLLIGMHRFGDVLPWDTDIDLDMFASDHVRLLGMVQNMPGVRDTNSTFGWPREPPFCNKTIGKACVAAPLSPTHWIIAAVPSDIETTNHKRAGARFVDVKTGFFTEVFVTREKSATHLASNMKWWWQPTYPRDMVLPVRHEQFRDMRVPIPRHPLVSMNGSFHETFTESYEGRSLIPMFIKDINLGCAVLECDIPDSLLPHQDTAAPANASNGTSSNSHPDVVEQERTAVDGPSSAPGTRHAAMAGTYIPFDHGRFAFEILRFNDSSFIDVGRFFTSDVAILGELGGTGRPDERATLQTNSAGGELSPDVSEQRSVCRPSTKYLMGEVLQVDNERFCPECHQDQLVYDW